MSESEFFEDGVWEDDDVRIDVYALFVLEAVETEIVNRILESNKKTCDGAQYLWLAGDVDELPDFHWPQRSPEGTKTPIDPSWSSTFVGKTIEEVANAIRSVPKPRKPLCKTYFVVLDQDEYNTNDRLLICKLVGGKVQAIACDTHLVAQWLVGHDRDVWQERWEEWQENGRSL